MSARHSSQRILTFVGLSSVLASAHEVSSQTVPERSRDRPTTTLTPSAAPARGVAPVAPLRLAESVVLDASFARRTLYTWTTQEQAGDLFRRSPSREVPFLTRSAMASGEPGTFARALAHFARVPPADLVSRHAIFVLSHAAFEKRRFAWPTPWATRRGLGDADYGDQLLEVRLRPDAFFIRIAVRTRGESVELEPVRVVGVDGVEIPLDVLVGHTHRLAGVFHVHVQEDLGLVLREYVLVNDAAIESVTRGGAALRALVERDRALAGTLPGLFGAEVPAMDLGRTVAAQRAIDAIDVGDRFRASLAFASTNYARTRTGCRRWRTRSRGV